MTTERYPEAAFLSAMTASTTHEARNVLAIIKESAGLVEDLVQMYGTRGNLDREKVDRALKRIDLQVKRGADLLTTLNRLAHTFGPGPFSRGVESGGGATCAPQPEVRPAEKPAGCS